MERWSDFKDAILSKYWEHLRDDHQFEPNFDINLEYKIMKDWLDYEQMPDDGIIKIRCDHCKCNHTQSYRVTYFVERLESEEE
jgi:hypothetical protein